jgi:hypothetical protein
MKIVDIYSPFDKSFSETRDVVKSLNQPVLKDLYRMAVSWGEDLENVQRWMVTPEYEVNRKVAKGFLKMAPEVVKKIEAAFGGELKGELRLGPSLMHFDGFARYDSGSHTVWFGMDHPDADEDYLRVLLAHELSHVYRDHRPDVWKVFGKPLEQVSRQEYLDQMDHKEHLASEGLATLFSQALFPDVPPHVHHYYSKEEFQWCLENSEKIEEALIECIRGDQDVWKFYGDDSAGPGSPSRTQYFWAALRIMSWLERTNGKADLKAIIKAHDWPADKFDCFGS